MSTPDTNPPSLYAAFGSKETLFREASLAQVKAATRRPSSS